MHNRIQSFLAAVVVLSAAFAGAAALAASDPSDAEDHSTYGTATHITIAPKMHYSWKPTYPPDLTVTTTILLQKQGTIASGTNTNVASMSGGTLNVRIPQNATDGTTYCVVLKAVSANPSQTAYINIQFDVVASLSISGDQGNVVAGSPLTAQYTASGMGTKTWSLTGAPSGVSIDPSTGRLSGSIATPGDYTLHIVCTSSYGETATKDDAFRVATPLAPTNSPSSGAIIYEV